MTNHLHCSAVINIHREGRLLVPTLKSLSLAKKEAERWGFQVEFIVVADRPDPETLAIANDWQDLHLVYPVDYGELGSARKFGIQKASQQYIFLHDGDDLVSSNLYRVFLDRLRDGKIEESTVYHCEYFISFGRESFVRRIIDSDDPRFDPFMLTIDWFYSNKCVINKNLINKFPIPTNNIDTGIGCEDWQWVADTIANGVKHSVLPETICFYRAKAEHASLGATPSMIFGFSPLFRQSDLDENKKVKPNKNQRDIDEYSTQQLISENIIREINEKVQIDPNISTVFEIEHGATVSTIRSLHHRAAHGARLLLSGLDTRKKLFLFISDSYSTSIPAIIDYFQMSDSKYSASTHQLIVIHETNNSLYAGALIPDKANTIYLSTQQIENNFAVPSWFRNRFVLRLILQSDEVDIIEMNSSYFKHLCQEYYKILSSKVRRIFVCYANMTNDPMLGAVQRLASIRRILARSKLFKTYKLHFLDVFGALNLQSNKSSRSLYISADLDTARRLFMTLVTGRATLLPKKAKFNVIKRRKQNGLLGHTPQADAIFVYAGGAVSDQFIPAAKTVIEICGFGVVMAQTMQHISPRGEPLMVWYGFEKPEEVIASLIDLDHRGYKLGLSAYIAGAEMIKRYNDSKGLLNLLGDLFEKGDCHLIKTTSVTESRISIADHANRIETVFTIDKKAKITEEKISQGEALLTQFGTIFTSTSEIVAARNCYSEEDFDALQYKSKSIQDQDPSKFSPWTSETLASQDYRFPIQSWINRAWIPTVQFSISNTEARAIELNSLLTSAERFRLLPSAWIDYLTILKTNEDVPEPPSNKAFSWNTGVDINSWKVLSHLSQVAKQASKASLLVVPFLENGGAIITGLAHIKSLTEQYTEPCRILITDSNRFAEKFEYLRCITINLPEIIETITQKSYESIPLGEKEYYLEYLLKEISPARMLYCESYVGTQQLMKKKLSDNVCFYLFTSNKNRYGRVTSYEVFVPELVNRVDKFLFDNSRFAEEITDRYYLEEKKTLVLPMPLVLVKESKITGIFGDPNSKEILWAGRLDYQKNPDTALRLAELMPDFTFHLYGSAILNDNKLQISQASPNVILHGAFSSIDELMCRRYLCYLNTSRSDGVPLIMLEVASFGIPILTSRVGGASELLGEQWPYVSSCEDEIGFSHNLLALRQPDYHQDLICRQLNALDERQMRYGKVQLTDAWK